jgi:hypothetical protein
MIDNRKMVEGRDSSIRQVDRPWELEGISNFWKIWPKLLQSFNDQLNFRLKMETKLFSSMDGSSIIVCLSNAVLDASTELTHCTRG